MRSLGGTRGEWGYGFLAALATAIAILVLAPSAGANTLAWGIEPSPSPGSPYNQLWGVSCVSTDFCAAVGDYGDGTTEQTLTEMWDGTSWSIAADPPGGGDDSLLGVSCTSSSFCMAVGQTGNDALIEQWNGKAWVVSYGISETSPSQARFNGVSCISSSYCMAVGSASDGHTASGIVATYNGTKWSPAAPPADIDLYGVSCVSSSFCAAGGRETVEVWNGKTWAATANPNASSQFNGVSCTSQEFCVAVGADLTGDQALVETWDGKSWTDTDNPGAGGELAGVSCVSESFCAASGWTGTSSGSNTLAETWDGSEWSDNSTENPNSSDNFLNGVSCSPDGLCAAAGWDSDTNGDEQTLIETATNNCVEERDATPPGGEGFMVVTGTFEETPTRWTSCGGNVRINGIDIVPDDKANTDIVIDSEAGNVTSTGPVSIPAGAHGTLFSGLLSNIQPSGWPLKSQFEIDVDPDIPLFGLWPHGTGPSVPVPIHLTLSGNQATATWSAGFIFFPDDVTRLGSAWSAVNQWTTAMQAQANWNQDAGFVSANVSLNKLALGPLNALAPRKFWLSNLSGTYSEPDGHDRWTISATLSSVPNDISDALLSGEPASTTSLTVQDDQFAGASATVAIPGGVDLGNTVSLEKLSVSISTNPENHSFVVKGGLGAGIGPELNLAPFGTVHLIGVDGDTSIAWDAGCALNGEAGEGSGQIAWSYSGSIEIGYGALKTEQGALCFQQPFFLTVSGDMFPTAPALKMIGTQVSHFEGWLDRNQFFYGEATGNILFPINLPLVGGKQVSVKMIATNAGLSACVRPSFGSYGWPASFTGFLLRFRWGAPGVQFTPGCGAGPLGSSSAGRQADVARVIGRATRVQVRTRLQGTTFAVLGRKHPPAVRIAGPGGVRITVPAKLRRPRRRHGYVAYSDSAGRTTYVTVLEPATGTWKVSGGVVTVTPVAPAPTIRSQLSTGPAGVHVLHWHASHLNGETLVLLEQAPDAASVLLSTTKQSGNLTIPSSEANGEKTITALVLDNGLAVGDQQVAAFQ